MQPQHITQLFEYGVLLINLLLHEYLETVEIIRRTNCCEVSAICDDHTWHFGKIVVTRARGYTAGKPACLERIREQDVLTRRYRSYKALSCCKTLIYPSASDTGTGTLLILG